jgi:NAD(P)-dependent dehydrogenase (short-subunit alcohol dehydrogenase family)
VAIVSGAGPGLGRSICVALAGHGARVVTGDIDADSLRRTLEALEACGTPGLGRVTDIRDAAACEALVQLAVEQYGGVDILVNDAYDGGDYQLFEHADLDDWQRTADVNIWGTLRMTRAALGPLCASDAGRVVMICTHGVELIQPTFGAYTGSKAAIAHHTKLLAAELGQHGIRVNAVFPGPILGPALIAFLEQTAAASGRSVDDVQREWGAKNSLGYLVPPEQIAGSVVFLASDLALPITGQALYANAGETFH